MATKTPKKRTNNNATVVKKSTAKKVTPSVQEQGGFLSWFKESTADKKPSK